MSTHLVWVQCKWPLDNITEKKYRGLVWVLIEGFHVLDMLDLLISCYGGHRQRASMEGPKSGNVCSYEHTIAMCAHMSTH